MRLICYESETGGRVAGLRGRDTIVDLNRANSDLPATMKELLSLGPDALARAEKAIESGQPVHRNSVKLLAPVPNPQKVICIGLNYADHAEESGAAIPEEPIVFSKFPTAVAADGDYIRLPSASSEVDYEAELVVVMGTGGRDIPLDQAYRHVAGYTCGHDVSARDWQLRKPGGQWLLGKSFDTFAPFGPELVTPDEVESPENLDICLRLNGKVMQKSNTDQLIFPIDHLISYVSTVCTLQPGDVIFTGTPPGVGAARKPPVFLKAGDKVEVEIEKIGILRNVVTA